LTFWYCWFKINRSKFILATPCIRNGKGAFRGLYGWGYSNLSIYYVLGVGRKSLCNVGKIQIIFNFKDRRSIKQRNIYIL
jgi:hypothetical protein